MMFLLRGASRAVFCVRCGT